jgi:hypothetical protein
MASFFTIDAKTVSVSFNRSYSDCVKLTVAVEPGKIGWSPTGTYLYWVTRLEGAAWSALVTKKRLLVFRNLNDFDT